MSEKRDTYFNCRYQIAFCPKYRRKILVGEVATKVEEVFRNVAKEYNFEILEMDIQPTYCNLEISCDPYFGITECIKKLKLSSASELKKTFPEIMKRIPNIWTRQVFIRTIGSSSLEDMNEFIEKQSKK